MENWEKICNHYPKIWSIRLLFGAGDSFTLFCMSGMEFESYSPIHGTRNIFLLKMIKTVQNYEPN